MNKVTLPEFPIKGGCQCGKIRYTLKAPPSMLYCCHCTQCQKQSSSAFGQSMRIRLVDIEVAGEMARCARQSASGNTLLYDFCSSCGTRLFHRREAYRTDVNLKPGSLDDTSWLIPAGHIWTGSKQPWVQIPAGDIAYESQPQDYSDLMARWRDMISP